ncbi:MAG: DUF2283 domain-containing protein [Anaerolineae bacterium]|nr:DUF2283 domain-containing protein [Anaerolineae bacterium]MDW8100733.1 DUF2283 domain-containing protein [Anaerolineae bacterium]
MNYIDPSDQPGVDSLEVAPGSALDFDVEGRLGGIDIDHAGKVVNLSHVEAKALPLTNDFTGECGTAVRAF